MQCTQNICDWLYFDNEEQCSQDLLEIYVSCIRPRGGWNNNASSTYDNCCLKMQYLQQKLQIVSVLKIILLLNLMLISRSRIIRTWRNFNIHCLEGHILTDFQQNVIYYTSRYLLRYIINHSTCPSCTDFFCTEIQRWLHTGSCL